jgi:glyoxylase-like metal-dependent hydrolase (beta-lactamase superfamily II)
MKLCLAPNPGVMTLDGTNTWILPGGVVIDPGPAIDEHLARVREVAGEVTLVLLTHGHEDHSEAANAFGCPVRAWDDGLCSGGGAALAEGESVAGLRVLHVPGHTSDSVAFWYAASASLFTGDTVLGRGTSVVAYPDGALAPYLASLQRLRAFVDKEGVQELLPGHGPIVTHPAEVLDFYLAHREERLEQVRAALEAGATTAREVVERVYADVDRALWPAAERSVRAQLDYVDYLAR